jgi:hypothetical protein
VRWRPVRPPDFLRFLGAPNFWPSTTQSRVCSSAVLPLGSVWAMDARDSALSWLSHPGPTESAASLFCRLVSAASRLCHLVSVSPPGFDSVPEWKLLFRSAARATHEGRTPQDHFHSSPVLDPQRWLQEHCDVSTNDLHACLMSRVWSCLQVEQPCLRRGGDRDLVAAARSLSIMSLRGRRGGWERACTWRAWKLAHSALLFLGM